jgi:anti-sigma B factor antagonist
MNIIFDLIKVSQVTGDRIDYATLIFKAELPKKIVIDNSNDLWIFFKTLVEGGALKIYIDMQNLEYIDSSGIGIIINTAKLLRKRKGDLVIANVSEKIKDIFTVIKLEKFIRVYNSEVEAIKSLRYVI